MPESSLAARLLFLHAQTPLHPGSGTALGAVDLPVQRERHTQYPTIPGSALKGVLRDAAREYVGGDRRTADRDHDLLTAAFGPASGDNKEDNAFAGAVSITDARVLAFPVRSLRGTFAWVTCPAVLGRLANDLRLAGMTCDRSVPTVASGKALFKKGGPLDVDGKLVLEEFDFDHAGEESASEWVAENAVTDAGTQGRIRTHFAVLADDDFGHFVRHATEVTARVGLDYATKTVKTGALFYQEFLPAETLFYSVVLAHPSRKEKVAKTADDLLGFVADVIDKRGVLQIGGDETTGKGYCFARLANGTEEAK